MKLVCSQQYYMYTFAEAWSFEISANILRHQKQMIGLDSYSKQVLIIWIQFDYISL